MDTKITSFSESCAVNSWATAIAGKRWPPVPPPAIIKRIAILLSPLCLQSFLDAPIFISIPIDAIFIKRDVPP